MLRYLTSFILIGLSIAVFTVFTQGIYADIKEKKSEQSSYEEASVNSKALESERDKLTAKFSNISVENLDRIRKFLPDSVDNIRLILELEQIALPYNMVLKDVQYTVAPTEVSGEAAGAPTLVGDMGNKNYGAWDLGFSVTGTYTNFLNFMRDLENNLRIVDISSIQFSSVSAAIGGAATSEVYRYTFNIKTYWLKN